MPRRTQDSDDAPRPLLGQAEAKEADRRRKLGAALRLVGASESLRLLCRLVYDQTACGATEGWYVADGQAVAYFTGHVWGPACGRSKLYGLFAEARGLGLLAIAAVVCDGRRIGAKYAIDWPGIEHLLRFGSLEGAAAARGRLEGADEGLLRPADVPDQSTRADTQSTRADTQSTRVDWQPAAEHEGGDRAREGPRGRAGGVVFCSCIDADEFKKHISSNTQQEHLSAARARLPDLVRALWPGDFGRVPQRDRISLCGFCLLSRGVLSAAWLDESVEAVLSIRRREAVGNPLGLLRVLLRGNLVEIEGAELQSVGEQEAVLKRLLAAVRPAAIAMADDWPTRSSADQPRVSPADDIDLDTALEHGLPFVANWYRKGIAT